ncbi:hypothetical protein NLU13_5171 [Sarocladium strictum]|uniref:Uncharacterized protein n=1 Tax=Sarocladium strictum TaxID=5046 RepID=A0AA39GGD5_SARSR|nr:hypothetical protein NLU13_5171 [Sarocladium strictum]
MRFSWGLVALVCAFVADVQAQAHCKNDVCMKAVTLKASAAVRKKDCSAFLATTVTPAARTITRTRTITKTTTKHPVSTKTSTEKVIVTKTSNVRATKTAKLTQTVFDDRTATFTVTTGTATVTESFDDSDLFEKRDDLEKRAAKTTPRYASVCGSNKAYRSACLCASAKVVTKTAARPTSTKTVTKTKTVVATGKPTIVKTRVVTSKTTKSTTRTFTTVVVTQTATTKRQTRTVASNTVNVAATQTVFPPAPALPRAGFLTASTGRNERLYTLLSQTSVAGQYALHLVASSDGADVWRYTGPGEPFVLVHSSSEPSAYGLALLIDAVGSRFGPEGGAGIISYITPWDPRQHTKRQGGTSNRVECTISPANGLQCVWGDTGEFAEWWTCNGVLSLVRPGADPSPFCNGNAVKLRAMGWSEYEGPASALDPPEETEEPQTASLTTTSEPNIESQTLTPTPVTESSLESQTATPTPTTEPDIEPQTLTPTPGTEPNNSDSEPQTSVLTPSTESSTRPNIPDTPVPTPSTRPSTSLTNPTISGLNTPITSGLNTPILTPSIRPTTDSTRLNTPTPEPSTSILTPSIRPITPTPEPNTPIPTSTAEPHTPTEPQPTAPSLPRRGRIQADNLFFGVSMNYGTYNPKAFVMGGDGGDGKGDIFEYTGPNEPLKIIRSENPARGFNVFYDRNTARFGPENGNLVISMFAPWGPPSEISSADLEEFGVQCSIDEDNNFDCLWGTSGHFADWWFCDGFLSLARTGVDASTTCSGENLNDYKLTSVKWIDYDGPLPEEPEPEPSLPRVGRLQADNLFFALSTNPNTYEYNAFVMGGDGAEDAGDVFEYAGAGEALKVRRSANDAVGFTMSYDPWGARFGPTNGGEIISMFSSWGASSSDGDSAKAWYQAKCLIDKQDNFKCLWQNEGEYADWWFCDGYLSLVKPGADATSVCDGWNANDYKIQSLKWVEYDGSLPALPEPKPIRRGIVEFDLSGYKEYASVSSTGDSGPGHLALSPDTMDRAVGLEYTGPLEPIMIQAPGNEAGGLNLFFDPAGARFGPPGRDGVVSAISPWKFGIGVSKAQELEEHGIKCFIEEDNNNFQCYWNMQTAELAEWWMCEGLYVLAAPGADVTSACSITARSGFNVGVPKWINV